MISKNIVEIGHISLNVAWILGSAAVFIFKDLLSGFLFLIFGFILIGLIRWTEHEYYKELKSKEYI